MYTYIGYLIVINDKAYVYKKHIYCIINNTLKLYIFRLI